MGRIGHKIRDEIVACRDRPDLRLHFRFSDTDTSGDAGGRDQVRLCARTSHGAADLPGRDRLLIIQLMARLLLWKESSANHSVGRAQFFSSVPMRP
jgi:hypothetical protein